MELLKWATRYAGAPSGVSCWAMFSKYIATPGHVHFTDDLTRVPANQLGSLRPYGEQGGVATHPAGSRPDAAPPPVPPQAAAGGEGGQSAARGEYDPSEQSRKQALEKDYQTLLEEKVSLEKEGGAAENPVRANPRSRPRTRKIQALNSQN
ncbi:MAG: hypothetical protein U5J82_00550 [Desulfobacterales bacterium]|nr:hypothetical protein [Desulfobacterales bacterium]